MVKCRFNLKKLLLFFGFLVMVIVCMSCHQKKKYIDYGQLYCYVDSDVLHLTNEKVDGAIDVGSVAEEYSAHGPFFLHLTKNEVKKLIIDKPIKLFNARGLFENFHQLQEIENIHFLDVSECTDLSYMFDSCQSLSYLDLSSFDTHMVKDMTCMFRGCDSLVFLDLHSFDTHNVHSMASMFNRAYKLTDINVSNWDVSNVHDMSDMFQECENLRTLDLSNWNASSVQNFEDMFRRCVNIESINFNGFDTRNARSLYGMFSWCENLRELDLRSFDTANVSDFWCMFYGCKSLEIVNLLNFNDANCAENRWKLFDKNCKNLHTIIWDEAKVPKLVAHWKIIKNIIDKDK